MAIYCLIPGCTQAATCNCPKGKETKVSEIFRISAELLAKQRVLCEDHKIIAKSIEKTSHLSFTKVFNHKVHDVKAMTGLSTPSFEALLLFCRTTEQDVLLKYAGHGRFELGITYETQLLIALSKFRLANSDRAMSAYFQVPVSTINASWRTWLRILSEKFKTIYHIPSLRKCQKTMPAAFKKYPNTRTIIDATEVDIEPPRDADSAAACYSYYKGRHTVKFLVAIAPCGTIVFTSEGYPGNTSDKQVTVHSGILDKLEPGDGIMAYKGFLIDDLLPDGVSLNIPTGLWQKKQMTEDEVDHTKKIAKARVHVERSIKTIKEFKILKHVINRKLLSKISAIFYVCAMLTSFNPANIAEIRGSLDALVQ